ncbi:MAG: GTPase HflX [Burkholderiales bacterium]
MIRPEDNAVLVSLEFGKSDFCEAVEEFRQLAVSAGLKVNKLVRGSLRRIDPAFYVGRGKVEEIKAALSETQSALAVFNHELSPGQQRNLERELERRVIDRTTLILDIFSQRARSFEGKLQVELAQLEHLATRLVRGWTHLERQKGGIGLRGPGETQLETDRRLLAKRVKVLKDRLAKLSRQRSVQRRARRKAGVFSVSLVGYTNAGKSTLFNRLTKESVYTADLLFATLDTTARRLHGSNGQTVVLSDTVGFIRDLPHTLVAAFRATLEETAQADLLLHVVDAANPAHDDEIIAVNEVLAEIGAQDIPQIVVMNKIDSAGLGPGALRDACDRIARVRLSAATGAGIELLRDAVFAGAEFTIFRPEPVPA